MGELAEGAGRPGVDLEVRGKGAGGGGAGGGGGGELVESVDKRVWSDFRDWRGFSVERNMDERGGRDSVLYRWNAPVR